MTPAPHKDKDCFMSNKTAVSADSPAPAVIRPPKLLLSGLDSLYISFYATASQSDLDMEEFDFLKEKTRESRGQTFAEVELGTERFALMPYGKHPYRYVLRNEAFEVRLAEHMQPGCHVQFFSESLWTLGLDAILARFKTWAESINLRFSLPEVISRADWAFDYGLPVIDFTQDDFVSRVEKDSRHRANGVVQTFAFGKGEIVVRVYDKVAEIQEQSDKTFFYELWGQREKVWRIEMQVRGERLRVAGIATLADLKAFQNDLLRELATNHTSLRRPNGDSNRSRWPLHPLWKKLIADIEALPRTGLIRAIDPIRPLNYRIDRQAKSVYGMFKSLAALVAARDGLEQPPSLEQFIDSLPKTVAPHHWDLVWNQAVKERLQALRLGQW